MNTIEHGKARAGLITASVAKIIMHGGDSAWETLSKNLWAATGEEFAAPTTGARAWGHEKEPVGVSRFWEKHPEAVKVNVKPGFVPFARTGFAKDHPYRTFLGCSPDFTVTPLAKGGSSYGGEVKSPAKAEVFERYFDDIHHRRIPREHVDQVRFSLWVTGFDRWWFVTHFENDYAELQVPSKDEAQIGWVKLFRPKLDAFIAFYTKREPPIWDRLGAKDLARMLK